MKKRRLYDAESSAHRKRNNSNGSGGHHSSARGAERGARAAGGIRTAGGGRGRPRRHLDVTDEASLHAAAAKIQSEYGRLDILVNSVGIAIDDGPASQVTLAILRRTYDTNVFGLFAVTQVMLPLLRGSDAGRIVNLSSGLGSLTLNSDPNWDFVQVKPLAYNSSKAAVNMITVIPAAELRDTAIKVNAADPGYTATDMNANSGTQTVAEGAAEAVRLATLPATVPPAVISARMVRSPGSDRLAGHRVIRCRIMESGGGLYRGCR